MRRFLLVICTALIFVTFCSSFIFAYEKEIQTLSESVTASITNFKGIALN